MNLNIVDKGVCVRVCVCVKLTEFPLFYFEEVLQILP